MLHEKCAENNRANETRIREIRLLRAKEFKILSKNIGDQNMHLEDEKSVTNCR